MSERRHGAIGRRLLLAAVGAAAVRAATAFGRFEGRQVELPPLGVGAIVLAGERELVQCSMLCGT